MNETPSGRIIVARVQAQTGPVNHAVEVQARHHGLVADEPPGAGGADAGPAPYELLLSSLAACTAITLRMYGQRKGWDLRGVGLDLRYVRDRDQSRIERSLSFEGELSAEQRMRLAEIAERTPVTLTLKSGVEIRTELR